MIVCIMEAPASIGRSSDYGKRVREKINILKGLIDINGFERGINMAAMEALELCLYHNHFICDPHRCINPNKALPLANVIELINSWFDVFNSKNWDERFKFQIICKDFKTYDKPLEKHELQQDEFERFFDDIRNKSANVEKVNYLEAWM